MLTDAEIHQAIDNIPYAGTAGAYVLAVGRAIEAAVLAKQGAPATQVNAEYPQHGSAPDFDAIRDKRMSELTPAQRDDAHELWIRDQIGWFTPYNQEHIRFLLKRLDEARNTGVLKC